MSLPFGNANLTVYSYEPFSYTISNPTPSNGLGITRTSGIPPSYLTITDTSGAVVFSTTSNAMIPGNQQFTVSTLDASQVPIQTATYGVTIGPGRFLDGSGNSFVGSNYTFYAKEAITPIKLVAPFTLSPPTSTPTLPPGLSFSAVDVSSVTISGTPLVTAPQSNYLIIGKEVGSSKIVSSTLPIVVRNERIVTNITNAGLIDNMQVDTSITPVTLTTRANGDIRYTWSSFPVGIYVTDNSGNTRTSPFIPSDPSHTLIIRGIPTLTTASNFVTSGYSNGVTRSILTERISPSPLITSNVDVTFRFGETVLFDTTSVPPLYKDLTLDPSATYYRAASYFGGSVDISTIFSPNLRSDLSLAFNGIDRAYLIGNPKPGLPTNSQTFTIRAIDSNSVTRDLSSTITVAQDVVTFVAPTPVDACYNFVISRSADLSLNGYYPSPIQFSANAASGRNIQWSAPALAGTGLSLSDISGSTVRIVGTPSNVTSLQTLAVTATSFDTSATGTRNLQFEVVNDVVTLSDISASLRTVTQNKPITPIQVSATALSGRPIRSFGGTNFLPGLSISRTGVISGTPTSNEFVTVTTTITADTGFVSGTKNYDFINLPDKIVIALGQDSYTVPLTFSDIYFRVLGYSGGSGTIDTSSALDYRAPWQGGGTFTVSSALGNYLQGDFSTVPTLLSRYRFALGGSVGSTRTTQPVDVTVNNAPTTVRHLIGLDTISGSNTSIRLLRCTDQSVTLYGSYDYTYGGGTLSWGSANVPSGVLSNVPYGIHDMAQNSNVLVAVIGSNMIRSADAGVTWNLIASSNIQSIDVSGGVAPSSFTATPLFGCIATDGSANWLSIANGSDGTSFYNILRTSSNNGVDWVDTSVNSFVNVNSNTRLSYNNSRYFVTAGGSATNPLLYAESSNITTWTAPSFTSGDVFNDLAFSNNTALVVGSNASSSACYSSPNNGDTWSALSSSPISYSGSAEINTTGYAYGQWSVAGRSSTSNSTVSFSDDLVTWQQTDLSSGRLTATVEDGSAWLWVGTRGYTGVWNSNGTVTSIGTGTWIASLPAVRTKRIVSTTVSNGTPTLTFTMPYQNATNLSFVSPTQTSYTFWQYIPIQPITIEANYTPENLEEPVYYYVDNLPDGLTFTLDPTNSYIATITGTPVTFTDAPQSTIILASDASVSTVIPLVLNTRTILPTVQKQQTSAGSWTSYIRQYTEVNAATTARDNRATPAIEYRLGEFTRPEPPSVLTAESNCKC